MLGEASTDKMPTSRHETAKNWLNKRLRKPTSRPLLRSDEGSDNISRKLSVKRPQTAPSTGTATSETIPPVPQIPVNIELPSPRSAIQPPFRVQRPNSGVVKDVNAWLDTSTSMPPQPLMAGLSYWTIAPAGSGAAPKNMQYASPIVRKPEPEQPVTPSSQQVESMYRRGVKKVQAKMPSFPRTTSQRVPAHEQDEHRASSMPLMAVAYEQTVQGASPKIWTPTSYPLLASSRTPYLSVSSEEQALSTPGRSSSDLPHLDSARTSATSDQAEGRTEGRRRLRKSQTARRTKSPRPSTSGAQRDESMGDWTLSDAPTYSTGPAPPSYNSRPASIITTSSFGCIDGMSPAQREISRQRAAMRNRGMEGKVKKLRKLFKND